MLTEMRKYPVQHPLLKQYIKFFWVIRSEYMQLDHKLIPVRNIDLKFNLSETPHYFCLNGQDHLLDEAYFSGLHDHFRNARLKLNGKVDMLGICFSPEGFFPFIKVPVSEFKNQMLGAGEVGLNQVNTTTERLKSAPDVPARLNIIENELLNLLNRDSLTPENFRQLSNALKLSNHSMQISEFCERNNVGVRKLERMFNKYVGISAKSYVLLHRFQNCINQLFQKDYSRLSDVAYDNGYFDQMHFIREFKRFTGDTPKDFIHQNNSMLQVAEVS